MRALLMKTFSDALQPVLEDVAEPEPGPGQVSIAVHFAGLNFPDVLMAAGKYQVKPALPFSPGMEVAGTVAKVGAAVSGLKVGDRVMSMCSQGGFAEQVCVDAERAFTVPAGISLADAAVMPVNYGTAYHALADRARLRAGEWVAVFGAGTGVGLVAVELASLMGARVIAIAGSEEKLALARSRGAAHAVNYRLGAVRDAVKALTGGRGADVFFDPVGGEMFNEALRCIAPAGRLLVVGFASGSIPAAPANLLLLKSCDVVGVNAGYMVREHLAEYGRRFQTVFGWIRDRRIAPPHIADTYALKDAGAAMRRLAAGESGGKTVVAVREETA